jgi:hypothetical protein
MAAPQGRQAAPQVKRSLFFALTEQMHIPEPHIIQPGIPGGLEALIRQRF